MLPRRLDKNGWTSTHVAVTAILPLLGLLATLPAWIDIARLILVSELHRYVLLTPLILLWLVWVRRVRAMVTRPGSSVLGLTLLGLGAVCYVVGGATELHWMWHLGAVIVLLGMLITALGHDVSLRFAPALVAVLFLTPIPPSWAESLGQPIRELSMAITCRIYRAVGIDAWLVADRGMARIMGVEAPLSDASSGLAMVLALLMVCYGFVFGLPLKMSVRLMLLALSALMAVVCSALAVLATAWLYGMTTPWKASLAHQLGEWVMLLLGFLLLVTAIRILGRASVPLRTYALAYTR